MHATAIGQATGSKGGDACRFLAGASGRSKDSVLAATVALVEFVARSIRKATGCDRRRTCPRLAARRPAGAGSTPGGATSAAFHDRAASIGHTTRARVRYAFGGNTRGAGALGPSSLSKAIQCSQIVARSLVGKAAGCEIGFTRRHRAVRARVTRPTALTKAHHGKQVLAQKIIKAAGDGIGHAFDRIARAARFVRITAKGNTIQCRPFRAGQIGEATRNRNRLAGEGRTIRFRALRSAAHVKARDRRKIRALSISKTARPRDGITYFGCASAARPLRPTEHAQTRLVLEIGAFTVGQTTSYRTQPAIHRCAIRTRVPGVSAQGQTL